MPHVILVRMFGGWTVFGPYANLIEAERHITDNLIGKGLLTSSNWEVLQLRPPGEMEQHEQGVK